MELMHLRRTDDPLVIDWIVIAQGERHALASRHSHHIRFEMRIVKANGHRVVSGARRRAAGRNGH
jgi:hypothetical protein